MEVSEIKIDMSPKELYEPLWTQKSRYKDLWGGRGRGGSHEATLYALFKLTSPQYYRIAFVRMIYKDVRHSLWRDFKDRVEECGVSTERDLEMSDHEMRCVYKPTGNIITSFGAKAEGGRTAKLKSLAGYNLVIIEECDELSEEEFNQLDDSLRTTKGESPEIIRIFNPPGRMHWLWNFYNLTEATDPELLALEKEKEKGYWQATPKEGIDVMSIFSTYHDNIENLAETTVAKWLRYLSTNPEYYFTIVKGLISEGQRGRIFAGWRPITQDFFRSIDARSIFGLDFGENDPAALVELKIVKNKAYGRQHFYKDMTVKQIGIALCKLGITSSDLIIADSANPLDINKLLSGWTRSELSDEEIEKYPGLLKGFNVMGAIKGPGSVVSGINEMKDLEWCICEDSTDWWKEYREYKWALDKEKNPTNQPEDKNNHCFIGTTLINTLGGEKMIKDIVSGQTVFTQYGHHDVVKVYKNGLKQVNKYIINNNIELTCTSDHQIYTREQGWIPISHLKKGMTVIHFRCSTEKGTTSIKEKSIIPEERKGFMSRFTGISMVMLKKASMFIMSTRTLIITILLIFRRFSERITCQCTHSVEIGSSSSLQLEERRKLPQYGIRVKKGATGTGNNVNRIFWWHIASRLTRLVNSAGQNTKSLSRRPMKADFAQTTVKANSGENRALMTKQDLVANAGKTSLLISMHEKELVVESVQVISEGVQEVYDLQIATDHSYFANGLLVHNCHDPARYVVSGRNRIY